ncbi:MAG: hypothetical protein ONB32_02805 [candidate division KSB1 bacterium]|nr:hypothetical protein [candidate division KSB1 bacterium]MDZ7399554.1 hypothetical protein [candidate division KSB1 bacterium]
MLEMFFDSVFFNSVNQMVEYIIRICIYMFTLGVVVYFITMLFRLSTDTEGRDNIYHLFVVGFGALGLATYRIWAIWLGKLFVLLARAIFDLESGNIMTDYLGAFFANPQGQGLRMSFFNLFSLEALSSLSYFLVMIVYEIFVVIQVIVQIFFYLIGPLAIVISLFPNFRDTFRSWISNFCAVNFWSVLIAILFRLVKTLTNSPAFKASVAAGDKSVLWESFILGVIICIIIVLIPKLSLAIFKGGGSAADLGTYGTGITAGVVISTVWKRLKHITIATTQQIAAHTSTGVISGAQRLSQSPTASSTEAALRSLTDGAEGSPGNWPFEGGRVENLVEGM